MQAGAKRFGLHMMTGSCVMDETYWSATVSRLLGVAKQVAKEVGIEFEFVNIGRLLSSTSVLPSLFLFDVY